MAIFYNMIQHLRTLRLSVVKISNFRKLFKKITLLLKHLEKVFNLHNASFKISVF